MCTITLEVGRFCRTWSDSYYLIIHAADVVEMLIYKTQCLSGGCSARAWRNGAQQEGGVRTHLTDLGDKGVILYFNAVRWLVSTVVAATLENNHVWS